MMRAGILAAAYALDWIVGDPEWLPHPVRLMAWVTGKAEQTARQYGSGKSFDLVAGGVIAFAVPAVSTFLSRAILNETRRRHRIPGAFAEVWLASTCLATRNLLDEAARVLSALDAEQIDLARSQIARIVGRDTATLDEPEICRAVVETLAESLSDGIVAPLFYLALGGVPLAMAYKAVNTLDSMIGHRDVEYLYFGRVAARLDDAANWLPARIAAFLICLTAGVFQPAAGPRAVRTWLRDGSCHASPNAGQPESAMAGALAVCLGGVNYYAGERIPSPHLGGEFGRADRSAARRACRVVAAASLLACVVTLLVSRRLSA